MRSLLLLSVLVLAAACTPAKPAPDTAVVVDTSARVDTICKAERGKPPFHCSPAESTSVQP